MPSPVEGVGLGLRRVLLEPLSSQFPAEIDFLEVAPENWIGVGGRLGKQFSALAQRVPVALHGLSLDIGGSRGLDFDLLGHIKAFMARYECPCYSEHLTYCADGGHLYDLMPLPFTEEAVRYVAARVAQVQDFLGQRIALENASYYAAPDQDMDEIDFINAVIAEADCDLLLDVNNIYVNSINHRYDPWQFLAALPGQRAVYIHVAGHYTEAEDLRVDTHGADVIEPVWELLAEAYRLYGPLPTLLERDFNIPAVGGLQRELRVIHQLRGARRMAVDEHSRPA